MNPPLVKIEEQVTAHSCGLRLKFNAKKLKLNRQKPEEVKISGPLAR